MHYGLGESAQRFLFPQGQIYPREVSCDSHILGVRRRTQRTLAPYFSARWKRKAGTHTGHGGILHPPD